MKFLYPWLLTLLISGCANTLSTYPPVANPEQAVLLFSLSWSDQPGTVPGHQSTTNGLDFSLRNKKTGKTKTFDVYQISGLSKTVDFTKPNTPGAGSVFAVALPAGEYEFYRWRLYQGDYQIITNYSPLSVAFTLETGKIHYLGELNLEITRDPNEYNYGIFQKGTVNLHQELSKKDRDLILIRTQYPDLSKAVVETVNVTYQPRTYELYNKENTAVLRSSRTMFHYFKSKNR